MLPTPAISVAARARQRPRARSIGAVLLAAAAVLAPSLAMASPDEACGSASYLGTPAGPLLAAMVAVAGAALLLGVPRTSAVGPALALGAAFSLLGGAVGGAVWMSQVLCVESVVNAPAALLVLQGGSALAVIGTCWWLLYARDEFEPWGAARGVVASAAAAITTLVIGLGYAVLIAHPSGFNALVVTMTVALPWAVIVGATGWLRRSPALAITASVVVQAAWLLARFG